MQTLISHVQEHFAKYYAAILGVLVALSTLAGQVISEIGTSNPVGHYIAAGAAGVGTLIAGLKYMHDRFDWKKTEAFGATIDSLKGAQGLDLGALLRILSVANPSDASGQLDEASVIGSEGHPAGAYDPATAGPSLRP